MTRIDDITKQAQESLALANDVAPAGWKSATYLSEQGTARTSLLCFGVVVANDLPPPVADFFTHASTALPDLAKAWLAVCEVLEERGRVPGNVELSIIRAAILRRLSK